MSRSLGLGTYIHTCVRAASVTLLRMSPEALLVGQYSFASDVYSLGMVLFEIVCDGEEPFENYDATLSEDEIEEKVRLAQVRLTRRVLAV